MSCLNKSDLISYVRIFYPKLSFAGYELRMIQKQIDNLKDRTRPDKVGSFLALRRDVMFLEFDAAVRHCMRETFLATSNVPAYKVGDRMDRVTGDMVAG